MKIKKLLTRIDSRTRKILVGSFVVILLFMAARSLFWVAIFIGIASVSNIYNAHARTPFNIDFTKFGTVLSSVAYGMWWGVFVGLVSTFFSKLFSQRLEVDIFASFGGIILIAFLAETFSTVPIATLGIGLVVLYYLITSPINILLGDEPGYAMIYVGSSLFINYLLFTSVAPAVMPLL